VSGHPRRKDELSGDTTCRRAIDGAPAVAITRPIRTDTPIVRRFQALYRALRSDQCVLQQEERYQDLAHAIVRITPARYRTHGRRSMSTVAGAHAPDWRARAISGIRALPS
jgi:hypothetical protein